MHYAEFAEDEVLFILIYWILSRRWPTNLAQTIKLRDAIKEYEANKWKVIGQKVGKPAKVSSISRNSLQSL